MRNNGRWYKKEGEKDNDKKVGKTKRKNDWRIRERKWGQRRTTKRWNKERFYENEGGKGEKEYESRVGKD